MTPEPELVTPEPAEPEPADQLSAALQVTGQLIAAIRDEDWARSTPCPEWNVRDLVGHVVTGNYVFASVLHGSALSAARAAAHTVLADTVPAGTVPAGSVPAGSGLLSGYRNSAAALVVAFRQPGVLDQVFTFPIGPVPGIAALNLRVTEILVHGWDLARATGQRADFPAGLTEHALTFSRGMLAKIAPDRSPFAPPQPAADDAAAIDRLAACLGRDVTA